VIARIWRGRVRNSLLQEYCDYIARTGLRDYEETPGNRGAYMLTRQHATHGEAITISFWDSHESIAQFAGMPYDRARYIPKISAFYSTFPNAWNTTRLRSQIQRFQVLRFGHSGMYRVIGSVSVPF